MVSPSPPRQTEACQSPAYRFTARIVYKHVPLMRERALQQRGEGRYARLTGKGDDHRPRRTDVVPYPPPLQPAQRERGPPQLGVGVDPLVGDLRQARHPRRILHEGRPAAAPTRHATDDVGSQPGRSVGDEAECRGRQLGLERVRQLQAEGYERGLDAAPLLLLRRGMGGEGQVDVVLPPRPHLVGIHLDRHDQGRPDPFPVAVPR